MSRSVAPTPSKYWRIGACQPRTTHVSAPPLPDSRASSTSRLSSTTNPSSAPDARSAETTGARSPRATPGRPQPSQPLGGRDDIQATHAALSDIAETCLKQISLAEWPKLAEKFGEPTIGEELPRSGATSELAILALEMERKLSKERILELYLNHIYMGAGAYGIEAAARTYYNKSASQLSITEAATPTPQRKAEELRSGKRDAFSRGEGVLTARFRWGDAGCAAR